MQMADIFFDTDILMHILKSYTNGPVVALQKNLLPWFYANTAQKT